MAIIALNAAATGLRALSSRIDVVANNLANAETQAFKRQNVNFEDLMYLQYKQPGVTDTSGNMTPAGINVGLGVKVSNTQLDMTPGSLTSTEQPLDVAIQGDGFFHVKILQTIGDGTGYTRSGSFFRNKDGDMVLGIGDGYRMIPNVNIPAGATNISISQDGTVSYVPRGGTQTDDGRADPADPVRQPAGAEPAGREHLHRDHRQRPADRGQARRQRGRAAPAGVHRDEQRRPGQGAGHADQDPAELRAEQPVDPDGRPGAADDRQPEAELTSAGDGRDGVAGREHS